MDLLTGTWPLTAAVVAFVVATAAIAVFGYRLSKVVDVLADRTGIGEALAGMVLLGAATSSAGLIVSVVAALEGEASLAISNSVGGIAAQTAFIVAADLAYRRVNLEHAAPSLCNVFNTLLVVVLLTLVIVALAMPAWAIGWVHPVTPLLLVAYLGGLRVSRAIDDRPMWKPMRTDETSVDEPDPGNQQTRARTLWIRFSVLAAIVSLSGWVVARSGVSIIAHTDLSGSIVGTAFTSISTSLPELVTTIAAVRIGAPTLAVGGIVGGNAFDVTFVAVADLFYRQGAIYAHAQPTDLLIVAWAMLLTAISGAGLIARQRRGIGVEGALILGIYAAGLVTVWQLG